MTSVLWAVCIASTLSSFTGPVKTGDWYVWTVSGVNNIGETCPSLYPANYTRIIGATNIAAENELIDFQCLSSTSTDGGYLHLENVRLSTDTINYYAIYTKTTLVTMKNVEFNGYSGRTGETGGGAIRIRGADYTNENHNATNPSLQNVTITNCCRGIRPQDTTGIYVKDCTVTNISDNAFYFATGTTLPSGPYSSEGGCINSTVDGYVTHIHIFIFLFLPFLIFKYIFMFRCTATDIGQTCFVNIGGSGNLFINSSCNNSRGAGFYQHNSNGTTIVNGVTFTNANNDFTLTPWGGTTDDGEGAAIAQNVDILDTAGRLELFNVVVNSGGVSGGGTSPNDGPASIILYENGPGVIIVHCPFDYVNSSFPGGHSNPGANIITKSNIGTYVPPSPIIGCQECSTGTYQDETDRTECVSISSPTPAPTHQKDDEKPWAERHLYLLLIIVSLLIFITIVVVIQFNTTASGKSPYRVVNIKMGTLYF